MARSNTGRVMKKRDINEIKILRHLLEPTEGCHHICLDKNRTENILFKDTRKYFLLMSATPFKIVSIISSLTFV